jgi:GNAT superfamily N-acetyltransferase
MVTTISPSGVSVRASSLCPEGEYSHLCLTNQYNAKTVAVGLAETVEAEEQERFIGIGRYFRTPASHHAEVAFAVLDGCQGHGIGTLLLKHLVRIARINTIGEFGADVLASNHQMIEVFTNSGFSFHNSFESGDVRLTLQLSS